jgi:hypothetical protein
MCGAHNLRDLYTFDPDGHVRARSMADLLVHAKAAATASHAAGQRNLDDKTLAEIRTWYRAAVVKGSRTTRVSAARLPATDCGDDPNLVSLAGLVPVWP